MSIRPPLLLALLLALPSLQAQTRINRCVGADGTSIFTDRPCAALGAREHGDTIALDADARMRPVIDCARTVPALQQRVREAVAAGDVNRLAALFAWSGTGRHTAQRVMAELERMAAQPLHDVAAEPADSDAMPDPVALRLDHGTHVTRWRIGRRAGCWWLHY